MKNPFAESDTKAPRKSAQKEAEAQQKVQAAREEPKLPKKTARPHAPAVKPGHEKSGHEKTNFEAGFGIIVKPLVSEKTAAAGSHDTYAFSVHPGANKIEIKKAFTKMYGVRPESIQIANVGARATYFRRIPGAKSAWKKAYIRVPKGSTIAVYEGV
ncbi:MAG: 50S ribosomal protein L23 [Parcubacteria group bacterium]|nr:50S ribosomal protein L23 [Parcubacteria group bacterium]